jgi:hypothetical protein
MKHRIRRSPQAWASCAAHAAGVRSRASYAPASEALCAVVANRALLVWRAPREVSS